MKRKKGFSLVELLIVITIIGLLATIVLNSLSDSRIRAYNSKVKQQLSSFRTAAEIYFANQDPNSYGSAVALCSQGMFNDFGSTNGTPGLYIDTANLPNNTQVVCGSSGSAYAVKASLYDGTSYWCVDSLGASRQINGAIGTSVTICP